MTHPGAPAATTTQHDHHQPAQRRCIWCGHREHEPDGCAACLPAHDETQHTPHTHCEGQAE